MDNERDTQDDSVEFSADMAKQIEAEEAKNAAAVEDDFDLLGEDEDDGADEDFAGDDEADEFEAQADDDESDDQDGDESGDDEGDEYSPKRKAEAREGGKPKSKAQKRIEELAEKRRAAEMEAFNAEMKLHEEQEARRALEERIKALESGSAPQVQAQPNPSDFEYGEVDPKYIDAQVEYKLSVERAKFAKEREETAAQEQQRQEQQRLRARLEKVGAEGKKRFGEKFDEVMNKTNFPSQVAVDILDSDYAVDISMYLHNNVAKLREMATLTDAQRARAMGRLEERFSARASAGKKRTKAPETPGGKAKPKGKKVDNRYGPDDQDEFDRAFYGR